MVLSWVVSPLLSGIVAVVFFGFARTFILRSENSYDRAFMFLPALVFICVFINALFVLDKGVEQQCGPPRPRPSFSTALHCLATMFRLETGNRCHSFPAITGALLGTQNRMQNQHLTCCAFCNFTVCTISEACIGDSVGTHAAC